MQHLRAKYQHIQDNTGRIGENEPVFLLRGKDKLAPATLEAWANLLEIAGGDADMISETRRLASYMRWWQNTYANGGKVPDLDQGEKTLFNRPHPLPVGYDEHGNAMCTDENGQLYRQSIYRWPKQGFGIGVAVEAGEPVFRDVKYSHQDRPVRDTAVREGDSGVIVLDESVPNDQIMVCMNVYIPQDAKQKV